MRVAFNATPLLSTITGIGNYIVELGAAMARMPEIDAYSFYRFRWRHGPPMRPEAEAGAANVRKTLVQRVKPLVPFRGVRHHAARFLGFSRGLRDHRIDLYHEQNYVPLSYAVPVVITIHDLSWIRYPDSHPADRVHWLASGLPKALDRARAILVDSEFIRREVLTTFGLDTERVHVAHLGVPGGFRPMNAPETSASLADLGLEHGGYVLTVGTIEPRKNLIHVLEAYDLLPAAVRARFPLVIAGAKGWHSAGMVTRLRNQSDPQIRFLGHVTSTQLAHLYAGAALFAFPSIYEGFGLPPLEAMASGVPVIVSDRASLPEIVGDAGEMMNPDDPFDTAVRIQGLLEDAPQREAMAQRGLARAAGFTWAKCAEATAKVYRAVLAEDGEASRSTRSSRGALPDAARPAR
jgi:alpha-1,3-rhamnosyl/mannosyltransferase